MKMNVARASFSDALDASRGMVAMSQDMTPRNIYGTTATRHASHDYGFPQHASHNSSISSASTYQSYYGGSYAGSVDGGSVTDYSSASDEALGASRILPAPTQLIGGFPPEPASMMTQFNSKASLSASKKHKCKTCDKRFTRPSSLQTHMYSHTGEKRTFYHHHFIDAQLTFDQPLLATTLAAVVTSLSSPTSVATRRSTTPTGTRTRLRARSLSAPVMPLRRMKCSLDQVLASVR